MNLRILPDFMIIGAMKCATTTLHEQLARNPGVCMSRPKEPNFFSDDENFAHGLDWYARFFEESPAGALLGESSTHYTKRPTHPHTVGRIANSLSRPRLIYLMRHPIDRLVSHYLHERTVGRACFTIEEAVENLPELVDYGLYGMQIEPYLRTFGLDAVLPVFFDRLVMHPQEELDRIGRFLEYSGRLRWDHSLRPQNVARERLRHSPLREAIVQAPLLGRVRRKILPRSLSEPVKSFWRVRDDPPDVSPELAARLRSRFDPDLSRLGSWLGIRLNCASFHAVSDLPSLDWVRECALSKSF